MTNSTILAFQYTHITAFPKPALIEECDLACTFDFNPICGNDGVTYGNMCQLTTQACLKRKPISIAHRGACEEIAVEAEECNLACTFDFNPICGNDGVTYGNMCGLTSQACLQRKPISIAHRGACEEVAVEAEECNLACTFDFNPICGNDGVTYGNMCGLTSQACLQRKPISIAHRGACEEVAVEAEECNLACTFDFNPICGNDGVTYGNMCGLTSQACLQRKPISIAHRGACEEVAVEAEECNLACTFDFNPICGNDGVTYGNMCGLTSQACLQRKPISIAHRGACEEVAVEVEECNLACTFDFNPICGNDGVTYGNMCQLTSQACLLRKPISIAHPGAC
ncbi:hypothetical protein CAPTEDRAFT_176237 [Capitella teleta]|uniref:Kazal-like domain-containing protein n=1 Tax=Capitella teleta TaxID=283909 RepID=R7U6N3_CAPTE|nr:hypothetical protein CAPTEDRAFT_176237 [Capitella teleta]|eukprot:ELU01806.1 hypothetical protein CAPTEDRAFT_176237 [Capitella teleta]